MTRYAVGDLQGCLQPLKCLLDEVTFNAKQDQLWLVGDLINRGPESLATLRFVKELGDCVRIVLGNHDLHFLAVATGTTSAGKSDTFDEILSAPDCEELVAWLMQQKLFYSDPSNDYHMVHAGIPPNWTLAQTQSYASEVEAVLQSKKAKKFFEKMYGNTPDIWREELSGYKRLRVITNYLTRMRYCTAEGQLDFANKLDTYQGEHPNAYAPWFAYPDRLTRKNKIIFGHWAALEGNITANNVYGIDTGCVWGRNMTMMNLETQRKITCDC